MSQSSTASTPLIGVLALQGAFAEHIAMLHSLGVRTYEIRNLEDFASRSAETDGLIIPGGESTVQLKLLHSLGLFTPLRDAIRGGMPVFGTCAGMIVLAAEVDNNAALHDETNTQLEAERQERLATMDIRVARNAYGRQLGSFSTSAAFAGAEDVPMTFIRAPYILSTGKDVKVLAKVDGNIVAAEQGAQLVTSFHPELGTDTTVHSYFIRNVLDKKR